MPAGVYVCTTDTTEELGPFEFCTSLQLACGRDCQGPKLDCTCLCCSLNEAQRLLLEQLAVWYELLLASTKGGQA